MKCVIIGCGGTGGWLGLGLVKMLKADDRLLLIDADAFERKNMDRQLGCRLGQNKAVALKSWLERGAKCEVDALNMWLRDPDEPGLDLVGYDTLFCCADNHRARVNTLRWADALGCLAVICGNEYETAEAYAYLPEWQDTDADPRVSMPEILDDTEGDPLSPPCTGGILESHPQLAMANMSAAAYALRLWWLWTEMRPQMREDCVENIAIKINSTRLTTFSRPLRDSL